MRGFSLIELIVVLAIVGLLASAATPMVALTVQRAKESELRAALRDIRSAIDAYKRAYDEGRITKKADASGYPPNLEVLAGGVTDARSPTQQKIYFIRRLPRDPFSGDASASAAKTWGVRSYASPPDEPREGADVYDVFSRAPGAGLSGVAFREW